jgi:hypothetical protein
MAYGMMSPTFCPDIAWRSEEGKGYGVLRDAGVLVSIAVRGVGSKLWE